jgi:hypothetical protein
MNPNILLQTSGMQFSRSARLGAYVFAALSTATLLSACGGGGASGTGGDSTISLATITTGYTPAPITSTPATPATPAAPPVAAPVTVPATLVTDIRLENTGTTQSNMPFTFGQVFVPGQVQATDSLSGRLDDGTAVLLQMDVKATHPDGSVRHAVISGVLPTLAVNAERKLELLKRSTPQTAASVGPAALLNTNFTFSVHAKINGVDYAVAAEDLLKAANPTAWLKGAIANEWLVSAPLRDSAGVAHPHLSARFAIRWYDGVKKARVDVSVENDWAFEPSPQNFTYNAEVIAGGKSVYAKNGLTHLHHARWRKMFWWNGDEPQVNIKHNTGYLIASRAVPNYDQATLPSQNGLNNLMGRWSGDAIQPMGIGFATGYMPMTGGRADIGILPSWTTMYLLSMDKRAKQVTVGTGDLAGSWSIHYRDKKTDRPVTVRDYPYMTILGRSGDTRNPATGKYESFPGCAGANQCDTPYSHDTSHQPNLSYVPYLVTGDYYYLEELQFWAMYNTFESNPNYRQAAKGLYQDSQVRGQAWSMRTAAEAAYITPDNDVLKEQLTTIVNNNLDWYNATYANNASANALGVIANGYAYSYLGGNGIAPWQDDFFTSAIGHAAELGFAKANALLEWKVKFSTLRMTAPGACWIDGDAYEMAIRPNNNAPIFSTMADVYKATHAADFIGLACASPQMASYLKLKVGEMTGFSDSAVGYPSNMQPALAYAADVGGAAGKQAWAQLMARTVKPYYNDQPQFNIVPR